MLVCFAAVSAAGLVTEDWHETGEQEDEVGDSDQGAGLGVDWGAGQNVDQDVDLGVERSVDWNVGRGVVDLSVDRCGEQLVWGVELGVG